MVTEDLPSEELEGVVSSDDRPLSQQEGMEEEEQENYFETYVPKPPEFPVSPPQYVPQPAAGLPPWVWITVGILLAAVFNKVMNFVSRPQEAVSEMMMKQMMAQMAGVKPGANPFAGMPTSGMPTPGMPTSGGTVPGMPPMSGMPTTGVNSPPPAVDVAAQTPPPPPPQDQTMPPPASNPSANGTKTPLAPSAPFFQDISPSVKEDGPPGVEEDPDEAVDFMFEMLKNPQMRESLYQFLPENMRNPEMLESVMASPMVREQFKSMMTPEMLQQVKGFRGQMDDPQMKSQLESMNVSPDILMQKLMNEPELCAMLQKPNIMNAVLDMQKDPSNMSKYVNDPEIMKFITKMNELTLQAQMQSQTKTETTTN